MADGTPPASGTLRLAIAGDGETAADILAAIRELGDLADVTVTTIATPDRTHARLRAEIERTGAPIALHRRFEELLASEVVGAVCIASPLPQRHAHAQAALFAGCHVLVQAPLAITVRGGARTVEAAAENDGLLAIFRSNRFSRAAQILRWAVAGQIIGRLKYVIDIAFGLAGVSPNQCFGGDPKLHDRVQGGGIILCQTVHDIAFLRTVCGDPIEVVAQETTLEPERVIRDEAGRVKQRFACHAEDTVAAHLRFANGAAGEYLRSWSGTTPRLEPCFRAWGSLGAVEPARLFLETTGEPADLEEAWKERVGPVEIEKLFPRGIANTLALELLSFVRAVAAVEAGQKVELPHTGREGLRDLATAWAIGEAAREGSRLPIAAVENLAIEGAQKDMNARWGIR